MCVQHRMVFKCVYGLTLLARVCHMRGHIYKQRDAHIVRAVRVWQKRAKNLKAYAECTHTQEHVAPQQLISSRLFSHCKQPVFVERARGENCASCVHGAAQIIVQPRAMNNKILYRVKCTTCRGHCRAKKSWGKKKKNPLSLSLAGTQNTKSRRGVERGADETKAGEKARVEPRARSCSDGWVALPLALATAVHPSVLFRGDK